MLVIIMNVHVPEFMVVHARSFVYDKACVCVCVSEVGDSVR